MKKIDIKKTEEAVRKVWETSLKRGIAGEQIVLFEPVYEGENWDGKYGVYTSNTGFASSPFYVAIGEQSLSGEVATATRDEMPKEFHEAFPSAPVFEWFDDLVGYIENEAPEDQKKWFQEWEEDTTEFILDDWWAEFGFDATGEDTIDSLLQNWGIEAWNKD